MKRKILIAVLLLLSITLITQGAAAAEPAEKPETTGLELWRAMELAEQNNPGLKSSNIEREKSEIDIKIA
ncbi:MAG: hypothetical protein EOM40_20100, partial [Clostridia bacterium]|nr:hypothetical protein [Clostridia bacterium]